MKTTKDSAIVFVAVSYPFSLQKIVLSAINYQYKKDITNDISRQEQRKGLKNYIQI